MFCFLLTMVRNRSIGKEKQAASGYNWRQVILGMGEKLVSDRFADAREDDSFTPQAFISRYRFIVAGKFDGWFIYDGQ